MATTKFYLDLRGKAKDGKGSVIIIVYHNFSTSSFSTGVRVSPNEWSGDKVIKVSGAEAINARLDSMKSKIDKQIALLSISDEFASMNASDIKRVIQEGTQKKQRYCVSDVYSEYCRIKKLKTTTLETYHESLKKVLLFRGDCPINRINLKWLLEFDLFLSKQVKVNSKSVYLRCLRAVCKYYCHIDKSFVYPFTDFQIKQEPTEKRAIDIEKLRTLLHYKVDKRTEMYRDYFFLMFYFIGVNAIDLLLAKKSQVKNGRFEYVRSKTGKPYSIKIEPEAKTILEKYEGKGAFLLDAMDHCVHYKSFYRQMNEALQKVGYYTNDEIPDENNLFASPEMKKVLHPLIEDITSYSTRHSWATIAFNIGVPFEVVQQALGHSFGNKTTLIYIKFDREKVDAANRKVIDYLFL